MAEAWDDGSELPQPTTNTASFVDAGRTYGKGRGFISPNNNNDNCPVGSNKSDTTVSGFGLNNNNSESGSGGWGFGDSRGRGRGGFRNRNDNERDNVGFRSDGGDRQNDRDADNNEDTDNKGSSDGSRHNDRNGGVGNPFRGRGGRGGSQRGGRGGFGNRAEDGAGGLNRFSNNGGGFGEKCNRDGRDDKNNNNDNNNYRPGGRGGRGGSRGGGGVRGSFGNRNEDSDGGLNGFGKKFNGNGDGDGENDSKPPRGRGGWGGGRVGGGGGGGRSDGNDVEGEVGQNPDKPPPVTYIPPEISMDADELFNGVDVGLNFAKYDEIEVTTTGVNCPEPIDDFKLMKLRNLVMDNIIKSGYTKPTPVQKCAMPIIMNGRDLMACAQTGSGKTAAFMVPIIHDLLERPSELKLIGGGCEPHCVVVAPTRELAVQIWRQALKFSKDSIIKCCVIYGGVATMHQGNQVANGCHILVATPGRLLDFVERRRISFASIRYVVLDEADRMLDMGFLESIRKMMDHETMVAKGERQTLMFSATFGKAVQAVAADFLDNYLFLTVGIVGAACSDVEQSFYEVTKREKRRKLMELLKNDSENSISRTIVFVETKKNADVLALMLSENDVPSTSIHGDRMQQQREEALRDFISGRMPVLVATAVAARGLDIKDVAHVINFDMPKAIDEYVHRIGRTGRVGNRGKATSFINFETDSGIIDDLVWVLNSCGQTVPDWLSGGGGANFAAGGGDKFGGHDVRSFGDDASQAAAEEKW